MILDYLGTEAGKASLKKFGLREKFYHLCEECCELYVEIVHTEIRKSSRVPKIEKLQEEICDVIILLDDLWGRIGEAVRERYDILLSDYEEFADIISRERVTKCLLGNLGQIIHTFTDFNVFWKGTYMGCLNSVAHMMIYLDVYAQFYKDGLENVMVQKWKKREQEIAVEKF